MIDIVVNIGNVTPMNEGVDDETAIAAWKTIEKTFNFRPVKYEGVKVKINACEIIDLLENTSEENYKNFFKKRESEIDALSPQPLFSSKLIITLDKEIPKVREFIRRLLELIFLSMNLCGWNGVTLYQIQFETFMDNKILKADDFNLCLGNIDAGWHLNKSQSKKEPRLTELPFEQVFTYLEKSDFLTLDRCSTSIHKAMKFLIKRSDGESYSEYDIVEILSILESFLLSKNEGKSSGLKIKLNTVLGTNKADEWVTKIYKLRSSIVHGDYCPFWGNNIFFTKEEEKEYIRFYKLIDHGILIVHKIIQDLIIHDTKGYLFEYDIKMTRI